MTKRKLLLALILTLILFLSGTIFAAPEIDIFDNWITSESKDSESGNTTVEIYQSDYAIPLRVIWEKGEIMIVMKPYKIEELGNEYEIYYQFDDGVTNRVTCKVSQERKTLYIPNDLEKELIAKMMTHEKLKIGSFKLPDPTAGNELSYDLNRFDEAIKKYKELFLTN